MVLSHICVGYAGTAGTGSALKSPAAPFPADLRRVACDLRSDAPTVAFAATIDQFGWYN
jgi:hypothetical protein